MQDVNSVARQSNTDAKALDAALYNQELTPNQVTTRVASFIPRARAAETTASALKPPGKIKEQELQRYLLQALQYRTLALTDLEAALKLALSGAADTPPTENQREAVANAYSELIASDVVYAASFQRPAQAILKDENVTDAPITSSVWGLSPELADPSATGNGLWIESVRDAGSSKPCQDGVIGTSIDEVTANGKTLVPGTTVTTVKLKIPSTFAVTVANHGNCPVRGIEIHLIEGNDGAAEPAGQVAAAQRDRDEDVRGDGQPGRGQDRRRRADRRRRVERHQQPLHLPRRLPELAAPRL